MNKEDNNYLYWSKKKIQKNNKIFKMRNNVKIKQINNKSLKKMI